MKFHEKFRMWHVLTIALAIVLIRSSLFIATTGDHLLKLDANTWAGIIAIVVVAFDLMTEININFKSLMQGSAKPQAARRSND